MKSPAVIQVRAWGARVGAVAFDPSAKCFAFEYYPEWSRKGVALAPLTMPSHDGLRFAFPDLSPQTFHGLPGLLADALPDRFGNALIDAWMAQRGIPKDQVTILDRLAYMGRRGAGALDFHPAHGSTADGKAALKMASLVENARKAVQGTTQNELATRSTLAELIRVGTSAGGARAKAVVAWNPVTHELRSGQFTAPEGFEPWLLKFDGVTEGGKFGDPAGYGRIEFAYHLMARAAGIQMTDCHLLEESGRAHFMTRRFDRDQGQKHHLQTLCAMDHLDFNQVGVHDYGQAFMAIKRLELEAEATDELFRRMTFNVMARNCDDHPKNFSFLLRQGRSWALAPAYDVTFAFDPASKWIAQQFMSVNHRFAGITRQDLLQVADRFSVRNPRAILAEVQAALDAFGTFGQEAGMPASQIGRIGGQFQRL